MLVAFFLTGGTEIVHAVHKFLDVFLTAQVLGTAVLVDVVHDARLAHDGGSYLGRILFLCIADEELDEFAETLQLGVRALVHVQTERKRFAKHLPEAHAVGIGCHHNLAHRGIADASCRIVDDTLESFLIVRVHRQAEVSNYVLDFLALIERESAINLVRQATLAQGLFEDTALGIGAVEHGKVVVRISFAQTKLGNLVGHDFALFHIAVSLENPNRLALRLFRKHFLADLFAVLLDQAIGCTHDGLRRAVVLLQLEELGTAIHLGELQDILDVGSTEGVDTLGIIAHHAHLLVLLGELQHNAMLGKVGVLILVYQHVAKLRGILLADGRKVAKEDVGVHQQVVEVHGVALSTSLPVSAVNVVRRRHLGITVGLHHGRVRCIGIGHHQVVLGVTDAALDVARLVGLVVQLHFLDDAFQEALRIGSIVDGEIGCKADGLRLDTENTGEDGVESPHPQIASPIAYLTGNAFLHFAGSLVGKGQCQDAPRIVTLVHQVGNLVGKYTGLSRTGTGNHQRRAVVIEHCRALAFIQFIQIVVHHTFFRFSRRQR